MEASSFTLVFWITMGWRFEEMQLPRLYPIQCTVFRDEMLRERAPVRAECMPDADPPRLPFRLQQLECAHYSNGSCSWPLLAGRKRI